MDMSRSLPRNFVAWLGGRTCRFRRVSFRLMTGTVTRFRRRVTRRVELRIRCRSFSSP